MKKNIEKKDDSKNKQEKLTPQQVWKNASLILGTKKKEPVSKVQETVYRPVDFDQISKRLAEVTQERIASMSGENKKERFIDAELKNSLYHIPDYSDLEFVYEPKKYVEIPDFFPKHPINIFESPDVYKKLDIDTLFFIFYSQSNTVQQYYAATQLKLYSWRFHTKYLTWFQRLDEPKLITTDYERGDFLFFDYDVTWSFMKKSDFTFEYKYLECAEL